MEEEVGEAHPKSKKTGVVFLPRVPKYMGPGEAKNYFQSFGFSVARSFFRAESRKAREARSKRGGNMLRKVFSEAWIEFTRKSHAKIVAKSFNAQRVGGKSSYCNDIWNIRYLSGFKFADLMEEEIYKKEMHDRKLRQQIELAKQETQSFMETVSLAKKVDYAKKKRRERGEKVEDFEPRNVKQRKRGSEYSNGEVGDKLLANIMPQQE
jgi:ESF2/ABP1 family protein